MKFTKIDKKESIIECESIEAEIAALIAECTAKDAAIGVSASYSTRSSCIYYVSRNVPGETSTTIAMYYPDTEEGKKMLADYREMVLRAARWERGEFTPEELTDDE